MSPSPPSALPSLAGLPHRLASALMRSGVAGTLHGGAAGVPQVGLIVPVDRADDWRSTLDTLADLKVQATLLITPEVARQRAADLWEATAAGHELAGQGPLDGLSARELSLWEAQAGQPMTLWTLNRLTPPALKTLAALNLRPLPWPEAHSREATPHPGQLRRVEPQDLRQTLPAWQALGYTPVPVCSVPGLRAATPRDLLIHLYTQTVEERFVRDHGVIDLAQRADAVMRVAPRPDAVPPLPLPRQTPTAELHLHSPRIVGINARSSIAAYRAYQRSLGDVAQALRSHPELAEAQAVFAVTLFHGPLEKNGFAVLDLPPAQARWYGLGFRLLRAVYGTPKPPSEATPKMAWMTREAFLARHGRG